MLTLGREDDIYESGTENVTWPVYYNANNLYLHANANWYSIDVSYTHVNDYWGQIGLSI